MSANNNNLPMNNSLDLSPKEYYYNITGVSEADSGHYKEALDYFTKAIELDPNNFISYFNRASIKMHLGDISGARIDFRLSKSLAIGNRV